MTARIVSWTESAESLGQSVVAIGVFDGVHIGHRALIADTVLRARARGVPATVVTFDRDPEQVVTPDAEIPQLLTLDEKLLYLSEAGLDTIVVVPFCVRLAEMSPERFLDDVLLQIIAPLEVVVGTDFRFGHGASGNVSTLAAFGGKRDFAVVGHELVTVDDEPVTATRIRTLIATGNVAHAADLLGRPHRMQGRVVHGRGSGGVDLGVPTANLAPIRFSALPADGVYSGSVVVDDRAWPAALSVGIPPTFPGAADRLEAHLLDYTDDLYGRMVTVLFLRRLREQRAFSSAEELREAILVDVQTVRSHAEKTGGD